MNSILKKKHQTTPIWQRSPLLLQVDYWPEPKRSGSNKDKTLRWCSRLCRDNSHSRTLTVFQQGSFLFISLSSPDPPFINHHCWHFTQDWYIRLGCKHLRISCTSTRRSSRTGSRWFVTLSPSSLCTRLYVMGCVQRGCRSIILFVFCNICWHLTAPT